MCNKRDDLSSVIDTCSADVVLLTETWLSSAIHDFEILHCEAGYKIYRSDRTGSRGGGVLIAVRDTFISSAIMVDTNLEFVSACVFTGHRKFIFSVCYKPPQSSTAFCQELHDVLNKLTVRFPKCPLFLFGDFNLPSIIWSTDPPSLVENSIECSSFLNVCLDFNLKQLVLQPTRCSPHSANVLDLLLTTTPELVSPLVFMPGLSDHCFIHCSIHAHLPCTKQVKFIKDYKNANFAAINNELANFITDYMPGFYTRTIQENWFMFKEKVAFLIDRYIPKKQILSSSKAPWFNAHLKRLLNKKKRIFRRAKVVMTPERWHAYFVAEQEYKNAIAQAKNVFHNITLPTLLKDNPRQFWNVVRGSRSTTFHLLDSNGDAVSNRDCCNVMNDVFVSCFSGATPFSMPSVEDLSFFPMDFISVDSSGVCRIIEKMKLSSSAGNDGINSKFLKNTKLYSSIILAELFSQSLQSSTLPDDWKVGKVVPLHKSGNTHSPLNYRPISLTSVPCKLLEHIIYSNLVSFLESNSFFPLGNTVSGSTSLVKRSYFLLLTIFFVLSTIISLSTASF